MFSFLVHLLCTSKSLSHASLFNVFFFFVENLSFLLFIIIFPSMLTQISFAFIDCLNYWKKKKLFNYFVIGVMKINFFFVPFRFYISKSCKLINEIINLIKSNFHSLINFFNLINFIWFLFYRFWVWIRFFFMCFSLYLS